MNYEQFVRNLKKGGIAYTLFHFSSATCVEVGRFGYTFDEQGKFQGGWIRDGADDWRSEGKKWLALINGP